MLANQSSFLDLLGREDTTSFVVILHAPVVVSVARSHVVRPCLVACDASEQTCSGGKRAGRVFKT